MKTFFCIDIIANGEHNHVEIQSTKLRKVRDTGRYGVYTPKAAVMCGGYEFYFELFLTYDVEFCGVVGNRKRQKRYNLHIANWQPYKQDENNMLHNVLTDVARVMVSTKEVDLIEDGVVVIKDKR